MDIVAEITKVDEDKRQVFGWASIVEKGGMPIIDKQGDMITIDELEKAAYDYVIDSRVGGEMHQKVKKGDVSLKSGPKKVGTMIESFVVTPEKIEKMDLPKDTPTGWWIGFQVEDDNAWNKVKKGDYKGFSIHGVGARKRLSKSEVLKMQLSKHLKNNHDQEDHDDYKKSVKKLYEMGVTSEEIQKHLIGSHDQDKHGNHSRQDHGNSSDRFSPGEKFISGTAIGVGAPIAGLMAGHKAGLGAGRAVQSTARAGSKAMAAGASRMPGALDLRQGGRNFGSRVGEGAFRLNEFGQRVRNTDLTGAGALTGIVAGTAAGVHGANWIDQQDSEKTRKQRDRYWNEGFGKTDESDGKYATDVQSVVKKLRFLGYSNEQIAKVLSDNE